MLKYTLPPMRPTQGVCPNAACAANGRIGIHSQRERRYICHGCGKTFSETVGTPLYGLKHPVWLVLCVLTLLAYGCPLPAIVVAFGVDERTVADWQRKAGRHAQQVQERLVCQGQLCLGQVQADELYGKVQGGKVWIATAMSVFSRLLIWGAVSPRRDEALLTRVMQQVRAATHREQPLLFVVDGFSSYVAVIRKVFRTPLYTGRRGRPRLLPWADLHLVQVVKHYTGRRLTTIQRRLVRGTWQTAHLLVQVTQVQLGVFNTAYVERFNATLRTWLPPLTRRSRTPSRCLMQLEAAFFWCVAVYNFCRLHPSVQGTPAMAAGLTEHAWSIEELVRFRC
jgi:transposase-like protein/IS1 family transposase